MQISLPSDLVQLVDERLQNGHYPSQEEVIREALRLLKQRDELESSHLEQLRQDVQVGLEQLKRGEGIPAQQVYDELRQRSEAAQQRTSG